jgi:hypothetical protein
MLYYILNIGSRVYERNSMYTFVHYCTFILKAQKYVDVATKYEPEYSLGINEHRTILEVLKKSI